MLILKSAIDKGSRTIRNLVDKKTYYISELWIRELPIGNASDGLVYSKSEWTERERDLELPDEDDYGGLEKLGLQFGAFSCEDLRNCSVQFSEISLCFHWSRRELFSLFGFPDPTPLTRISSLSLKLKVGFIRVGANIQISEKEKKIRKKATKRRRRWRI